MDERIGRILKEILVARPFAPLPEHAGKFPSCWQAWPTLSMCTGSGQRIVYVDHARLEQCDFTSCLVVMSRDLQYRTVSPVRTEHFALCAILLPTLYQTPAIRTVSPSMAAQDPLDLLRAAISSSLPITLLTAASEPAETLGTATYISILTTTSSDAGAEPSSGVVQFEKDAPTRYTSKSDTRTDFFTIGQLWLAWVERDSEVRQYLIKGQEAGGVYVGIADRKAVVDYLSGAGDGMGRVLSKDDATGKQNRMILTDSATLIRSSRCSRWSSRRSRCRNAIGGSGSVEGRSREAEIRGQRGRQGVLQESA